MKPTALSAGKCLLAGALFVGIVWSGAGCSRSKAAGEDADLRKSFSQKTFSINNVPPEQRERVRAIMESQKGKKK